MASRNRKEVKGVEIRMALAGRCKLGTMSTQTIAEMLMIPMIAICMLTIRGEVDQILGFMFSVFNVLPTSFSLIPFLPSLVQSG